MMKQWTSRMLRNNVIRAFVILFLLGLILGIVYFFVQSAENRIVLATSYKSIKDITEIRVNLILNHFLVILGSLLFSYFLLGGLVYIGYIIFEGVSIGFSISVLTFSLGIKGILFYLIYFLFFKLVFLIILAFFSIKIYRLVNIRINIFLNRQNNELKVNFYNNFSKAFVILIFVLVNDILIYLYSPYISSLLNIFL